MSDLNSCTGRWRLALLALATLSPGFVLASTGDGLARPESGYYADVRVHFAFDDMAAVRLFDGNDFRSEMKWDYAEIETLLANSGATGLDRLFFEHSPESLELLKKNGEARRGITLPDLNNWYTVVMPDEDSARELASQLSSSPFIRYAALTPIPMPNAVDISPTTPNYMSFQDYQDAAGYGVGIASAWAETNGTGVGVSIMHHEGGWVTDHEDTDMVYTGGGNSSDSGWWNHGTACVSILAAPNNGYGVTGLAYGADQMLSRGFWDNGSPNTWIACQGYLEVGDVISASWGYGGSLPSGYNCSCNPGQAGGQPAESDQADFDAIQTITANGYIVLNSASNGCVPMDNALYNGKYNLNVRDSGALIIGAIDPGGAPACFTNYGSRVDAHAWGSAVYSSGYGDLFTGGGDDRQYYTSGFGGTSAACPIVSGAVATLQAVYKQRNGGAVLDPWELRSLLRSTGTPQTSQAGTKPISNMPDLAELLVAIGGGGPDVTPPSISHTPIVSSGFTGPFPVSTTITDLSGVNSVVLHYSVNGGGYNALGMAAQGGNVWLASIPAQTAGNSVDYYITASDGAAPPNAATSPTWSFTVLSSSSGIVLLTPSTSAKSSGSEWQAALTSAGYSGTIMNVDDLSGIVLGANVDAVIVLLGIYSNNFVLPAGSSMATDLAAFINSGGNVYMEGGDCWAYDPGSAGGADFNSLFGVTGLADGSGDLSTANGQGLLGGSYAYTGENAWIDRLGAAGASLLFTNASAGYNCGYYQNGARTTACTSFELAGLANFDTIVQTLFGPALFDVLGAASDTTPPTVALNCLGTEWYAENPQVSATASDASGIASVTLRWQINGGPQQSAAMTPQGGDSYSGTLAGASFGSSVSYVVDAVDASANSNSATSNSCGTTIVAPANLVYSPSSASGEALPGASDAVPVSLQNTGGQSLDWNVSVTQDPFPSVAHSTRIHAPARLSKGQQDTRPGQRPSNSGGPDAGGYSWIDSDEVGGPAVSFNDISSTGTPVSLSDDQLAGPYSLGFSMEYYGTSYSEVYVCSNGFLSFASTTAGYVNQLIPDGANPDGVIAPFWDDLNPASGGTVYVQQVGATFVAQWSAVDHYGNSDNYTFQAILAPSGVIEFQYGPLNGSVSSCTVGIESVDNSIASMAVFNAAYLHSNMAIRFQPASMDPQWLSVDLASGTLPGGSGSGFQILMDSNGLASPQTYTGTVTITTDEPGSYQIPVSFFVGSTDHTPPALFVPCLDDTYSTDNITVTAQVSDASGLASVTLRYNTGGPDTDLPMVQGVGDNWSASLPGQPVGSIVNYVVIATDASANANQTTSTVCPYSVLPLNVPNLSITSVTPGFVLLEWPAVAGAASYNVYVANGLGGGYTLLQNVVSGPVGVAVSPDQVRLLHVTAVSY